MQMEPWPFLLVALILAFLLGRGHAFSVEIVPSVLVHEEHFHNYQPRNARSGFRVVVRESVNQNVPRMHAPVKCGENNAYTLGSCRPRHHQNQHQQRQNQNFRQPQRSPDHVRMIPPQTERIILRLEEPPRMRQPKQQQHHQMQRRPPPPPPLPPQMQRPQQQQHQQQQHQQQHHHQQQQQPPPQRQQNTPLPQRAQNQPQPQRAQNTPLPQRVQNHQQHQAPQRNQQSPPPHKHMPQRPSSNDLNTSTQKLAGYVRVRYFNNAGGGTQYNNRINF